MDNVLADALSRYERSVDTSDWRYNPEEFEWVAHELGRPDVDSCADPMGNNALCERFHSVVDDCVGHPWDGLHTWCNGDYKQLERLLGSEPTSVSQKAFTKLAKAMSSLDLPDEKGDKPMSLASQNGNTEMVKLLSKLGANVNERDADGDTPFSVAAVNEVSTPNLEPLPSPSPPS